MRLGIIGAGAIGAQHAAAATALGIEVITVVDQDAGRAQTLAETCGAGSATDPASAFGDSKIDAVVIGVPNAFHNPLALEAMQSGKDVLLEKPMALSATQCDELNRCAVETGQLLQIGFAHRFTAVGSEAKRVIDTGQLGEIYHVKAHLFGRRSVPGLGRWFTTKEIAGGGALIDLGVHLIDLSLYLLGDWSPVSVSGATYGRFGSKMRDYHYESMWAGPPNYDGICDVEDSAHALIRFGNGSTLDLHVAWAGNWPKDALPGSMMGLFGDKGGMTFELFGDTLAVAHEVAGRTTDSVLTLPPADQMQEQMRAFAGAVETRVVTGANGDQGRVVQAVVDAIYESCASQATVTIGYE